MPSLNRSRPLRRSPIHPSAPPLEASPLTPPFSRDRKLHRTLRLQSLFESPRQNQSRLAHHGRRRRERHRGDHHHQPRQRRRQHLRPAQCPIQDRPPRRHHGSLRRRQLPPIPLLHHRSIPLRLPTLTHPPRRVRNQTEIKQIKSRRPPPRSRA